jgi:hypothetical protein
MKESFRLQVACQGLGIFGVREQVDAMASDTRTREVTSGHCVHFMPFSQQGI